MYRRLPAVLIVSDDLAECDQQFDQMESCGWQVHVAIDHRTAAYLACGHFFDLVLVHVRAVDDASDQLAETLRRLPGTQEAILIVERQHAPQEAPSEPVRMASPFASANQQRYHGAVA